MTTQLTTLNGTTRGVTGSNGGRVMACLYQRGKVWYCRRRVNGATKWTSLGTTKRREAEKRMTVLLAKDSVNGGAGVLDPGSAPGKLPPLTLAGLWECYDEWQVTHLAPASRDMNHAAWRIFRGVCPGALTVADVSVAHGERLKRELLDSGYKPKTVNNYLTALRALFNRAIEQEWIEGPNPLAKSRNLRLTKTAPRWFDSSQIVAVLDAAEMQGSNGLLSMALGIYAGLRLGEVDACRWEWFDWGQRLLHVRVADDWAPKSRKERTIPLHSKLEAVLAPRRRREGFLIEPRKGARGRARYRFDLRGTCRAIFKAADVPWATAQTLRHTFASQLVSQGVSIYKVCVWLGHQDVRTTQQNYAHLAPSDRSIDAF